MIVSSRIIAHFVSDETHTITLVLYRCALGTNSVGEQQWRRRCEREGQRCGYRRREARLRASGIVADDTCEPELLGGHVGAVFGGSSGRRRENRRGRQHHAGVLVGSGERTVSGGPSVAPGLAAASGGHRARHGVERRLA